jgi:uncharacterized protein YdeI (YjbR/CyaY-like superfamily)
MNRNVDMNKMLPVTNREEWRAWLKKHYKTEKEIWLVYYRKHTGRPRLSYNEAVEEALCFGWIDSTVKSIDENKFAQRFSPRNPKSPYSQANRERLRALAKLGKIMDEVRTTMGDLGEEEFEIPADILEAIKASKEAWKNLKRFSQSYNRIRIAFIAAARNRPKEFEKRLRYFIRMTEKNKQFGFGGIEKYY